MNPEEIFFKANQAKKRVEELKGDRQELLEKHREFKVGLMGQGVNEYDKDEQHRSKVFKEALGPIEDELATIATEIGNLRDENSLEPKKFEIIKDRIDRLKQLEDYEWQKFLVNTETGMRIAPGLKMEKEIHRLKDVYNKNGTEENRKAHFEAEKEFNLKYYRSFGDIMKGGGGRVDLSLSDRDKDVVEYREKKAKIEALIRKLQDMK
jgi:capsule polysaccharide export protein KpsE/RkpR